MSYTKVRHHGRGIVVETGLEVELKTISNRTCIATINIDEEVGNQCFVSPYAPNSRSCDIKIKENYYQELEGVIANKNKRDICMMGEDVTARNGLGQKQSQKLLEDMERVK